jgi:ribosomal protein L32
MADEGERFRRLGRPRTGNLFEHYGVEVETHGHAHADAHTQVEVSAPVDVTVCAACGWYAPADHECDQCGEMVRAP